MTADTRNREEVIAELEAERNRQADQRVLAANAAWDMRDDMGDDAPCLEGVNEFLRANGIPEIEDDEEGPGEDQLRTAARNLVALGFDPEEFTVTGLERRLEPLRQQGATWLEAFIVALQRRARDGNVPARYVTRLIQQLRGEPEPAVQERQAQAAGNVQALRFPRAERGYTDVAMQVEFAIRIPSRNTSGTSDTSVRQYAERAIRGALEQAIRNGQYGAQLADGITFSTAVLRG